MTRWLHPPELERHRSRESFDPGAEGARYRLSRELSLAIWGRVCADATDDTDRRDQEQAQRRFHEIAARVAARGGRMWPDVGRLTRVAVELDGVASVVLRAGELVVRAPGRDTLVAAEARRWVDLERTSARDPVASVGTTHELPRAGEVAQAVAGMREQHLAPTSERIAAAAIASREPATPAAAPRELRPAYLPRWPRPPQPRAKSPGDTPPYAWGNGSPGPRDSRALADSSYAARKPEPAAIAGLVQRTAVDERDVADMDGVADEAQHAIAAAASSTGFPLPDPLKRRFEDTLGADLSSVRVHTGYSSERAADAVAAKAYTMGNDIHFGAGHYDPSSTEGQHLLAHEVVHTVQQSGAVHGVQSKLQVSAPGDSLEHEADRAADAMIAGRATAVSGALGTSANALQRKPNQTGLTYTAAGIRAFKERIFWKLPDAQVEKVSRDFVVELKKRHVSVGDLASWIAKALETRNRLTAAKLALRRIEAKFDIKVVSRDDWGAEEPDTSKDPSWKEYDSSPLPLSRIVVHHTADPQSQKPRDVQKKQMKQGYTDIAYHFLRAREWVSQPVNQAAHVVG
jgi:hypothetical protein